MEFGEPAPKSNDLPSMHDLVARDMEARKRFGLHKYGTFLQPFNGRDALKDAYEEILDLAVYIRQLMWERGVEVYTEPPPIDKEAATQPPHVPEDANPGRCYCGGPEEVVYGHVYGKGRHCRGEVKDGK